MLYQYGDLICIAAILHSAGSLGDTDCDESINVLWWRYRKAGVKDSNACI